MNIKGLKLRVVAPLSALMMVAGAMLGPTSALAASCTDPVAAGSFDAGGSTLSSMHWTSTTISATGPGGCTYSSIRIIGYGRAHQTTACDSEVAIRLGSGGAIDTGTNYIYVEARLNGSTIAQSGNNSTNQPKIAVLPCDLESASEAAGFEILIPNAFQTTFGKQMLGHSSIESDETALDPYGVTVGEFAATWSGTGAITDVQIYPYVTGGWDPHSAATLYLE